MLDNELVNLMGAVRQLRSSGPLLQSARRVRLGLGSVKQIFEDNFADLRETREDIKPSLSSPWAKSRRGMPTLGENMFLSDRSVNLGDLPTELEDLAVALHRFQEVRCAYSLAADSSI